MAMIGNLVPKWEEEEEEERRRKKKGKKKVINIDTSFLTIKNEA